VLRIEDLDRERCKPELVATCSRDLEWLGLDWDGAVLVQSRDGAPYERACRLLLERGLAYPCVCTRAEIAALSAPHAGEGEQRYPGTCRGRWSSPEQAERETGRTPGLRLHVPDGDVEVFDQLRGLTSLRKVSPHPSADIHPETASRFGITDKSWMVIESPRDSIRAKARVTDAIAPGVVCCQHGWWQECKALELPGYDSYGAGSANPSLLIGSDIADPISGSLPHRSFLCRVRPAV